MSEDKKTLGLDRQQLIHIGGEVIALGALFLYFRSQISQLKQEVETVLKAQNEQIEKLAQFVQSRGNSGNQQALLNVANRVESLEERILSLENVMVPKQQPLRKRPKKVAFRQVRNPTPPQTVLVEDLENENENAEESEIMQELEQLSMEQNSDAN